ncbi:dihydrofolate reductase-like domain-containing protein [Aspergillus germanicus]
MPPSAARTWKTRLFTATSLNDYLARSDHSITWLTSPTPNPSHAAPTPPERKTTPTFEQHMSTVEFIVMGRQTFDVCLSLPEWPYPKKELLVLSRGMDCLPMDLMRGKGLGQSGEGNGKVRIVRSIEEVKQVLDAEVRSGSVVYVDGGQTAREFLRRGWVDEVVLTVAPVVLAGCGRGLFGGLGAELEAEGMGDLEFTLVGVDVIENGMVTVYYRVKGNGKG